MPFFTKRLALAALAIHLVTAAAAADEIPPYELLKDEVLAGKVDVYIRAAMQGCTEGSLEERVPCMRDRLIAVWPQGKLAGKYCANRDDPFEQLDCITMTALAIDLAERSGKTDAATFLGTLAPDNDNGKGDAAILLGEVIWAQCPDGANARQCRVAAAQQKLDLSDTDAARCAPLKDDRKMVSCLFLGRFRNAIDAATARFAPGGS